MTDALTAADRTLLWAGNLAVLTTLMPDGSPQSTPVWVDADEPHVLVNTATGRVKTRNVQRDPRVAVTVVDRGDDYRLINVRGRVVDLVFEGADEHIDLLARRYLDEDGYPWHRADERRVILRIEPDRIIRSG